MYAYDASPLLVEVARERLPCGGERGSIVSNDVDSMSKQHGTASSDEHQEGGLVADIVVRSGGRQIVSSDGGTVVKADASLSKGVVAPESDSSSQGALFAASPTPLLAYERAFLDSLDDGSRAYRLLRRLCGYFRGTHHVEEIMWRENVERFDVMNVLEKYKDFLVVCLRNDE